MCWKVQKWDLLPSSKVTYQVSEQRAAQRPTSLWERELSVLRKACCFWGASCHSGSLAGLSCFYCDVVLLLCAASTGCAASTLMLFVEAGANSSLGAQLVKNLPAMQETLVRFLGWEDPLEKGQAAHSSILGLPWWLSR